MIRKCHHNDRDLVLSYLRQEAAYNIFIIGDIEAFGMDSDFQRIYAEIDDSGMLCSVFLRYRENAVYYSHEARFSLAYLSVFAEDPFEYLSGKAELMELIKPHLRDFTYQKMFFCKASSIKVQASYGSNILRCNKEDDFAKLYDLLVTIDEFGYANKKKEDFIKQKMESRKMGITLVAEVDNHFVSTVATTAETTINAMVVGVATLMKYRNKGYASQLMQVLMTYYFEEKKKELCLFYDNPEAGKIYHRLGFETFGKWSMMKQISRKEDSK